MPQPPDVPGYVLHEVLGSGGCAMVYLATQLAVGREVALKIDHRMLTTERDQRRFYREVHSAGRLSGHPHVIGVYDAGTLADGRPYLVMELCNGGSLADVIRRRGGLPPDEVWELGIQLADALGAAHRIGVLHRDIKPGNILINRYGTVGLADFGLASIISADVEQSATRDSLTPAYASPEAFAMAEPAPPTDVYSLGATLYALLNGRPPRFPATGTPSLATILQMHNEPLPLLPWVPAPLMDVIERSMAPDPRDRQPDGDGLRDALADARARRTGMVGPGHHTGGLGAGYAAAEPSFRAGPTVPPSRSLSPPSGPLGAQALGGQQAPAAFGSAQSSPSWHGSGSPSSFSGGPGSPQASRGGPAAPPPVPAGGPNNLGRVGLLAGAAVAVVALVVAGLIVWFPRGGTTTGSNVATAGTTSSATSAAISAASSGYGVPTTTTHCPATAQGGRCVTEAECWSGLTAVNGEVTITRVNCLDRHRLETFAIAPLPQDALTTNIQTLEAHPHVAALCSMKILLASLRDTAPTKAAADWEVAALPPSQDQFAAGSRVYRCLGADINISPDSDGTTGSAFTG